MDPEICLREADALIVSEEYQEASEKLESYFAWRLKKGFQPTDGDSRALMLMVMIGAAADELKECVEHDDIA